MICHSTRLSRSSAGHSPRLRCVPIAALLLALVALPALSELPAEALVELELDAQSGPKKHQKRQQRPIKMGTSGGNIGDFTIDEPFITCCSGTLGALLRKNDELFILSNNHVLALNNQGTTGDAVNQPGRLDNACQAPAGDFVGALSGFKRLKLDKGKNKVDAAIASVEPGTVDESGAIVGIGVPGNETVSPQVGMFVQKAGRTTGVRSGVIDLVNLSIFVSYISECSQNATTHQARFVKQFRIISTNNKSFSDSGDSGSAILEDRASCPGQVGLLFAGNTSFTVANKMSTVLRKAKKMRPKGKAELVGCDNGSVAATGTATKNALPELDQRQLRIAERIQARTDTAVMALAGVHGMGIGRSSDRPSKPVFKVLVDEAHPEAASRLPAEIEGIPVEVELTAPVRALNCVTFPESGLPADSAGI